MAFAPSIALDYLRRAHASGRLAHAYLLIGSDEAFTLARQLAALVARGDAETILGHPDVHVIEPESKARRVTIEQIRDLENALRLRATAAGGRKVGIVREADRMTLPAANAFLKTLEEPPSESLLLLVSELPESLPETILSRCIKVALRQSAETEGDATPEEGALLDLLSRYARERPATGSPPVAAAYLFLREFTQLLAATRARAQAEGESAYKREHSQYAQTTDGSWLEERETYHKTMAEARYIGERRRFVDLLANWWRDVLRRQTTTPGHAVVADGDRHGAMTLAGRLPTAEVLRRLGKLEELRENLERNIQEALALEVAFLQVFGA